jgi:hypothetical protein
MPCLGWIQFPGLRSEETVIIGSLGRPVHTIPWAKPEEVSIQYINQVNCRPRHLEKSLYDYDVQCSPEEEIMHLRDRSRIPYDFEILDLEEGDNFPWFHDILQFLRDKSFPSHAN